MVDLLDFDIVDDISLMIGLEVKTMIAIERDIKEINYITFLNNRNSF